MYKNQLYPEDDNGNHDNKKHLHRRWIFILCVCIVNFIISVAALGLAIKSVSTRTTTVETIPATMTAGTVSIKTTHN